MLIERIRIQHRVYTALKGAKTVKAAEFIPVQNALTQLKESLNTLKQFNDQHPFWRKIVRWFDRKFCFTPLANEIERIGKLAQSVFREREEIIPRVIKLVPPLPVIHLVEAEEPAPRPLYDRLGIDPSLIERYADWEEYFTESLSEDFQQGFVRAFAWYRENEGKESDANDIFKRLMYREESFLSCVKFLKLTNNSQSQLNLKSLDEALIKTMPDLFKCQLFRDADLTQLILECMERNLLPHAYHDLQTQLVDRLYDLIHLLIDLHDPSLMTFIQEIRSLYQAHCIPSHLRYVSAAFDPDEIDSAFQRIFAEFKVEHQEYIARDPALAHDLENPIEGLSEVGIELFLKINHFVQGEGKQIVDRIGLGPLIYIKNPIEEFWATAQELQRQDLTPDQSDQLILENLGLIIAYGLFKVNEILIKVYKYYLYHPWESSEAESLRFHRNAILTIRRGLEEAKDPAHSDFLRLLPPSKSLKILFRYFDGPKDKRLDPFLDSYLNALSEEDHEPFIEALEYLYDIKEFNIPIHTLLIQVKGCEEEFLRTVNHMREVLPAEEALNFNHAHEMIRKYALETSCTFGHWAISGDAEEQRDTLYQIAESFAKKHFEIAFSIPRDDVLSGSIEFLIKLHRFLELKNEPMLQEQLDELIFEALLPILSHHVYTMEGVTDLLLDYFIRQLPLIESHPSLDFHYQCIKELIAGIEEQPLKDSLDSLANRYEQKQQLVLLLVDSGYDPGIDLFLSEFSYLEEISQCMMLSEIENLKVNRVEAIVTYGPYLHQIRMNAYASTAKQHLQQAQD